MATYIIIAIIAYAIGSINFSVIISKKMAGFDVREKVVEMQDLQICLEL